MSTILSAKNATALIQPWTHWFFYGESGSGKCLGLGTPVLKYNGQIVPVEQVVTGDLLMGPDSTPRRVLSTCRSTGPLYNIEPIKGESWVCNDVHVLTVSYVRTQEILDIPLDDYLSRNPTFQRQCRLVRAGGITFPQGEPLPLDPYFLGMWFGDGSKTLGRAGTLGLIAISKPDPEILAACHEVAASMPTAELYVATSFNKGAEWAGPGGCPTHRIVSKYRTNALLDLLRSVVGPELTVPHQYLVASREDRLAFLAGWLDTDGYNTGTGFDWLSKRKDYAEAFTFLCRSLGFAAYMRAKEVAGYGTYWRVAVIGDDLDQIPLRIARKRPEKRKQIKSPLVTGFDVIPLGEGEYAGFTLDGDGRFLLGDFTITHNTRNAATFPRPLFLVPQNEGSIATLRGLDVPYYEITDMGSPLVGGVGGMNRALDEVEALYAEGPDTFPFDTIVIESLSHYSDLVQEELTGGATKPMDQFKWGQLSSHLRNVQTRLRRLDVHAVFTSLARVEMAEDKATILGEPLLSGQTSVKLPAACDVIGYCEVTPSKNNAEYRVHFRRYKHFMARSRFERLPAVIKDFNFAQVADLLRAGA